MPKYTPEEFAKEMQNIRQRVYIENDDQEESHYQMDMLMVDLLDSLGYGEGVQVFLDTPRWYA